MLRDPSIPKEKHSVLTLVPSMRNVRIDGTGVGGDGDSEWGDKYPMVLLPEGEHRIVAQYRSVTSSTYSGGSSTTTTSYTGDMSVVHAFKPGRFYLLYSVAEGNSMSLMITDETSPFVWVDSQERGRAQARNTAAREALAKLK
jgi:hypothetical protein